MDGGGDGRCEKYGCRIVCIVDGGNWNIIMFCFDFEVYDFGLELFGGGILVMLMLIYWVFCYGSGMLFWRWGLFWDWELFVILSGYGSDVVYVLCYDLDFCFFEVVDIFGMSCEEVLEVIWIVLMIEMLCFCIIFVYVVVVLVLYVILGDIVMVK